MDRLERFENLNEVLLVALQGERADIWTALPGIVQSFNPTAMTCSVQPALRFRIGMPALNSYSSPTMTMDPSGQFAWDQMPLLTDCPVQFPGGGGVTLTFPIQAGDEALIILASRCIDAWWAYGGIQNQNAMRMHDLSDGFIIPQVRSQPRTFAVSTTCAQLRNDAGTSFIQLNATTGEIDVTTTAAATITASTLTINGNVTVNGTITGSSSITVPDLVVSASAMVQGKNIGPAHVHSGVQSGINDSGGVV